MKTFLVYLKKPQDSIENAVFVKEGFSFAALIFNFAWLFLNRLWVHLIVFFILFSLVVELAGRYILNPVTASALLVLILTYIGLSANDFLRAKLEKGNYELKDVILAYSLDEAKYKFIANQLKGQNNN